MQHLGSLLQHPAKVDHRTENQLLDDWRLVRSRILALNHLGSCLLAYWLIAVASDTDLISWVTVCLTTIIQRRQPYRWIQNSLCQPFGLSRRNIWSAKASVLPSSFGVTRVASPPNPNSSSKRGPQNGQGISSIRLLFVGIIPGTRFV